MPHKYSDQKLERRQDHSKLNRIRLTIYRLLVAIASPGKVQTDHGPFGNGKRKRVLTRRARWTRLLAPHGWQDGQTVQTDHGPFGNGKRKWVLTPRPRIASSSESNLAFVRKRGPAPACACAGAPGYLPDSCRKRAPGTSGNLRAPRRRAAAFYCAFPMATMARATTIPRGRIPDVPGHPEASETDRKSCFFFRGAVGDVGAPIATAPTSRGRY